MNQKPFHKSAFAASPMSLYCIPCFRSPLASSSPNIRTFLHNQRSSFLARPPLHRRRYVSHLKRSTTPVSATSGPLTPTQSPTAPSLLLKSAHCVFSLSIIVFIQYIVSLMLTSLQISFPAPLASMLIVLLAISLLRLISSPFVDRLNEFIFNPAVSFLTRWLAVFFVPNLVMLPLAPALPSAHLARIAIIIIAGFFFTLSSTAIVCSALRAIVSTIKGAPPATATAITSSKTHPPSNRLTLCLALLTAISLILAVCSVQAAATAYALSATLLTFCVGQRFPARVKAFLHPLITCTGGTIAAVALLASLTSTPFAALLSTYYTRSAVWGAGDILAALLGPAVITFAFTMDHQRKLAYARGVEVVFSTLFATVASLFGTAFAARFLGLPAETALLALPRTVTAPLAIAMADLLGANVGLAASVVALTGLLGANIAASVLNIFGVKDAVVRGLAVGASAHGLGTAALSGEADAFPFAALGMTLVGIFSTVLIAYAPFRALVIRAAVGPLMKSIA